MVGSRRRGALMAALACGGLGLLWTGTVPGQQPKITEVASPVDPTGRSAPAWTAKTHGTTESAAVQGERFLTVHEKGRALRCRLIANWRLPDGASAYQVQVVATGEIMTIVEEGPSTSLDGRMGKMRALSTKIYHWGRSGRPPAAAPLPPGPSASSPTREMVSTSAPVSPSEIGATSSTSSTSAPVVVAEGPAYLVELTPSGSVPVAVTSPASMPLSGRPRMVGRMPRLSPGEADDMVTTEAPPNPPNPISATPDSVPPPVTSAAKAPAMESFRPAPPASSVVLMPSDAVIMPSAPASFAPGNMVVESAPPRPRLGERLFGRMRRNDATSADRYVYPAAATPAATASASVTPPKRDWHAHWDDGVFAKNQQPGQATVEQAPLVPSDSAAKDVLTGLPRRPEKLQAARTFPDLPPTATQDKKDDVLLNPSRAGLSDDKTRGRSRPQTTESGPPIDPRTPLGAQSVLAARNGLTNQIAYVPVPIVTVPQPFRPPVPPAPTLPKAPELNAYQNAFTPPPDPKAQPATPPIEPGLAMGSRPEFLPVGPPAGAWGQTPYPPFAYGPPPGTMPGGMMPPQVGAMGPSGPYPLAQVNYPQMYRGPMPPNPVIYQQPMPMAMPMPMAPYPPMGYPPMGYPPMPYPPMPYPPMPAAIPPAPGSPQQPGAATAGDQGVLEQQVILRDSLYPAQRELAADALAASDWRGQPQIVDALLVAARQDPAASVRAACCRSLARLNLTAEPILATLHALRNDPDPRVRAEAEQALVRLAGPTPPAPAAVQPARAQ